MRRVERFEGLAIAGPASVGPVHIRTPALLSAPSEVGSSFDPTIRLERSAPGERRLTLAGGPDRFTVALPILAPEIAPAGTGVFPLDNGVALLHAPLDRRALHALRETRPELLVLGNARALWSEGEALVRAVLAVRTEVGNGPLLWGPRVALPHRLPLLAYLGFDLLDTTEGELRASMGEFLDPTLGPRDSSEQTAARGCDCRSCTADPPGSLSDHARAVYRRAFVELHAALARGALRELVEARLAAEPALAELLRYADRLLADELERRAPVTDSTVHGYVLSESVRRAEMRRFRDRLVERYRPPPSKDVLLLVPCSRTKPYRRSPSHRRFAQALEGTTGSQRVHVVSVSSPIGLVPRELEDLPPARNYDIPVTGDWSAEERELVLRGVRHILDHGKYRHVVVHLDPDEYRFLLDDLEGRASFVATVVDGRPTSPDSVARLRSALGEARTAEGGRSRPPLEVVAEELHELASVQFGRPAADRMFSPPVRLAGRPWFQRITDGHQDLASVREERGLFHLTVAGALRLGDAVARVDVEPSLSLEGDVFAPGVLGCTPDVRAGDSVGLFQEGRLSAVGEAVLPAPLLGDVRRGLAVRVRHRVRRVADTAKTDDMPPDTGR